MAEERRDGAPAPGKQEGRPSEVSGTAPVAKKKKKYGKGSIFFLLLLLAFGVGAGLHFSGLWDARPLVWEIVPQIPYVGKKFAGFFGIPEQYTLTVAERRAYEQNERQKLLDERERDLLARESAINAVSGDIADRLQRIANLEVSAKDMDAQKAEDAASVTEKAMIAQRIKDFNTMSARNAAQVVGEMRDDLAARILQGLTSDARASILSKMDAKKAARLVELLSILQ